MKRADAKFSHWRAWAGLIAAPAGWALHQQAGSALNYADCGTGDGSTVAMIGAATLLLALAGGWLSWSVYRADSGTPELPVHRFIAAIGVMSAALFGLTIVVQITAGLILPSCFR
jgi:hypothetical protein